MKNSDTSNWEAFGLLILKQARKAGEETSLAGLVRTSPFSLASSRWILELAADLKLIDSDEEEFKKSMGGHR